MNPHPAPQFDGGPRPMRGPWGYPSGDTSWLWFSRIAWIVIVIAIIVGLVLVLRALARRVPIASAGAISELDLRYARGELDRAEYLQRRSDLLNRNLVSAHGPPLAPPAAPPSPGAPAAPTSAKPASSG